MRPKYETKYDNFFSNKQLDAIIREVAAEMKKDNLEVADAVHFFLQWQKKAFNEMMAPGYSWCGLGFIKTTPDRVKKWDKLKEESKLRKERRSNPVNQTKD